MQTINRGVKILIIDDSDDTREIMLHIFKKKGFIVEAAENSKEALEIVALAKPDIIIFNITMSEIDGFETGRRLRENPATQNIPIIFLSACKDSGGVVYELPGAQVEYIEKPCNIRYLIKQANKLVAFSRNSLPATE